MSCAWIIRSADPWDHQADDNRVYEARQPRPDSPSNHNVCELVHGGQYEGGPDELHHLLPLSLRLLRADAAGWIGGSFPSQLGHHHARLPVVHSSAGSRLRRSERGIWFYYARGCSDLHYDVGRTLAARHKVHAALRLAMISDGLAPLAAAERVASWLLSGPMNASRFGGSHLSHPDYQAAIAASGHRLAQHLCSAARGMVGPQAFTAQPGWGRACAATLNQTKARACRLSLMLQRFLVSIRGVFSAFGRTRLHKSR